MVTGSRTAVLGGAMDFSKTADPDGFAEVNVTSYGGGAGVEPGTKGVSAGLEIKR